MSLFLLILFSWRVSRDHAHLKSSFFRESIVAVYWKCFRSVPTAPICSWFHRARITAIGCTARPVHTNSGYPVSKCSREKCYPEKMLMTFWEAMVHGIMLIRLLPNVQSTHVAMTKHTFSSCRFVLPMSLWPLSISVPSALINGGRIRDDGGLAERCFAWLSHCQFAWVCPWSMGPL